MNYILHTWRKTISIVLVISTLVSSFSGVRSSIEDMSCDDNRDNIRTVAISTDRDGMKQVEATPNSSFEYDGVDSENTDSAYGGADSEITDLRYDRVDSETGRADNGFKKYGGGEKYQELLQKLDTPLDIYNYIRKYISSEEGLEGSRTLEELVEGGVATASENALLLSQLLRDKGYKTQFVYGKALLNEKQLRWITDKESIEADGKTDIEKIEQEDGSALFEMPHIWVRAYLPITDYRGAGNNSGRYEWVELDTYVKNPKSEDIEELTLLPLSLQYKTEGDEKNSKKEILDDLPEDIYDIKDDEEETTTEDTTEITTGLLDTTEESTDTTEETTEITTGSSDTTEDTTSDPDTGSTTEIVDPDSPTTEVIDVDAEFFKTFDTAEDFASGDGKIYAGGNWIDSSQHFYTMVSDKDGYGLRINAADEMVNSDNAGEEGVLLDTERKYYLMADNSYTLPDMNVEQKLYTELRGNTYTGTFNLNIKDFELHLDTIDFYKGHAYAVSLDERTWTDAREICESMGGHLAVINNAEENEYIRNLICNSGVEYAAIGMTDEENEGQWKWIQPTDSSYSNWEEGEPNDGGMMISTGQDYAYMYAKGTWDDGEGEKVDRHYICEWDSIDSVAAYQVTTATVVMKVSDDVEMKFLNNTLKKHDDSEGADNDNNDDKSENDSADIQDAESNDENTIVVNDLHDGYKEYIITVNLQTPNSKTNQVSDQTPDQALDIIHGLTAQVEIKEDKAFNNLIKDVNIYYSTGRNAKSEKLKDINFTNYDTAHTNYGGSKSGRWSAIVDSGKEDTVWDYFDFEALYETNSSIKIYASATNDADSAETLQRFGQGDEIITNAYTPERGVESVTGRYLCLHVYMYASDKWTTPFLDSITVGANTEKVPSTRDKKYLSMKISGLEEIYAEQAVTYEFSAVSNMVNAEDIVWEVRSAEEENDDNTQKNCIYSNDINSRCDFKAFEEGEYILRAFYKDDPSCFAEKRITVKESRDYSSLIDKELDFPYFNMWIEKTAYASGDDVKVVTDIPDNSYTEIYFDNERYKTAVTEGCFEVKNVKDGRHSLNVMIKNKSGNKFSRTISFDVYEALPNIKTWFDKEKYFEGDDAILYVEDGYTFVDAVIDGDGKTESDDTVISENGKSVTFIQPASGSHVIEVKLKTADAETITLRIYLFINDAEIESDLDDVEPLVDIIPPFIDIISPEADAEVSGKVDIICTVIDETLLKCYEVKFSRQESDENDADEYTIAEGTEEIKAESVGELDTDQLEEGVYRLSLHAIDEAGNHSYSEIFIVVTAPEVVTEETTENTEETTEDTGNTTEDAGDTTEDTDDATENSGDTTEDADTTEEITEDTTEDTESTTEDSEDPTEEPTTEEPLNPEDKTPPVISFTYPEVEEIIKTPTDITGSSYDETELSFWRLEYAKMDSDGALNPYYTIAEGIENLQDAVLGRFDTTMLMNGTYELRLTAKDKGGNTATAARKVYVEGNLKVGNMHIGFTDMTENIGKAKISINRIYDSRFKENGDFGYGWNMDISGMKLIENHPITDGYAMSVDGSAFNMTYRLYETLSHDVIVTYGDGTSDRFVQVINGGISSLIPVSEVSFSYRCITDPKKKLEILSDTTAEYEEGQMIFFDDDIYTDYDFKLTTDDGVIYYMNKTGVYRIEDTDGRVVNVDDTGYHGDDGAGIIFARDSKNRITSVQNSDGKTVTYIYDENGNLSEVTDTTDRTVKFTYDNDHNLISIIGPDGKEVSRNEYDDAGRLIATIDADGNRIEYSHDIDGREELITDRLGNSTLYIYDDNGNIISKTDANGNTTETTYDEYGNILTYKDAEGNVTVSSYDASGNLTSVTDAEGNSISVEYDTANRPVKLVTVDDAVMKIAYDSKGEITETTDVDGSVISYERDADGNVKSITDEIGKVMSSEYDSLGRVIATTDAAGNRVEYTYDSEGHKLTETYTVTTSDGEVSRTIKYNYNDAGELISTEDPDGHISTIERNNLGQTTAIIDSEGRRTSYEYDKLGNTTKITYPDGTSESFVYDAEGNLTSATGRTGNTAEYTYDKVGNLKKIHDARGNDTLYSYDKNYNLTGVTYATGAKVSYTYDSLNRNTSVTDNDGNITRFTYDSRSLLTSVTDARGNVTRYEYNAKGERIKAIYPDETSSSVELDVRARVTARIDQSGNRTEYTYDSSDRLVSVKQPDGAVTSYTYDKTGNLLSFKDAKGRITRYEYDKNQRVIKTTMPDGSESHTAYDIHGYVTKTTDFDGSVTNYDYDELGRPVFETKTGVRYGKSVSSTTEYTYDDLGRVIEVRETSTGMAGSSTATNNSASNTSTVSYVYDEYGCITDKTYDNGQRVSYEYDDYGRVTEVSVTTAGDTLATNYEYDAMDRLTRVIGHDGKATVYTYDANGNRSTATYANGVTLTYTYDECNRLKVEKVTDKNQKLIAQYEYTTEGGERTKVKEVSSDGSEIETEYAYDNCNRLLSETISKKKSGNTTVTKIEYTYDQVGNRFSKTIDDTTTEYTYNSLNQLTYEKTVNGSGTRTTISETTYSYDANGNMISKTTDGNLSEYYYDLFNRMIGFSDGSSEYSYTYDAEGVRRSKTCLSHTTNEDQDNNPSTDTHDTTLYVSDTLTEFAQTLAETDETGSVKKNYTIGFEHISNTDFTNNASGTENYYILDGHNDVRMLLDDSASVKSSYRYSAYGEILDFTGVINDGYYYTGEYMDSETGLYYLRARYMNPSTGTFTSLDSYSGNIYDPASLHRYLYCNASPVKYADPSGNSPILNQVASMTISVILASATTASIMGVIGGIVNAGFALVNGGDCKQVVNAFIEGFKSGAKIGAYLGALTGFVAYCFSINIIKASAAVALSHDSAKALSEFAIDRDGKKLANQLPYILLDIVFFEAASIKTGDLLSPNYKGRQGCIEDYNNVVERTNGVGSEDVPKSLLHGEADTRVYFGVKDGKNVYVGITKDLKIRQYQHGERFDVLNEITTEPLTRRQARAIEQVLIEDNPQFSNKINSISPKRDWYNDAISWARKWLTEHGY
ncbi:RHS repeat-associated core domain-containing protein [Eubacterium ruminantium]|nr:RHS repeat-associated core domain-containing protein [Eubacterium ruminantium]